jgi:lipoate-protein ligase A
MITEEEARKSLLAEQILDSEVFQDALQKLKEEYITKWLQNTNLEDVNERESIHKAIQLIPEIEKHLRIIVEKGKLTKTHINKIRNVL